MNKTIRVRRTVRMLQKPELLMDFKDYNEITRCHKCNEPSNVYTYKLVLGNIYLCPACTIKWDRWGIMIFKEMIGFE